MKRKIKASDIIEISNKAINDARECIVEIVLIRLHGMQIRLGELQDNFVKSVIK